MLAGRAPEPDLTIKTSLFTVRVIGGTVNIRLLRHAAVQLVGLLGAVQVFVPKQGAPSPLLGFQRRPIDLELVNKLGRFRGVVGAAKKGHGSKLPESVNETSAILPGRCPPAAFNLVEEIFRCV